MRNWRFNRIISDYSPKCLFRTFLSWLCCFTFLISFSQNQVKVDGLEQALMQATHDTVKVNTLNKLCWELKTSQPEKALQYGEQALELAKEIHFKRGQWSAFNKIGVIYKNRGEYEKALKKFRYRVAHKKDDDDYYAVQAMKGIRECLKALDIPIPNQ